jgi:homoserine dehydrogenase
MTDEGLDFSLVLKEAQAHGYAEADPTLDIEGMDSAHKLQILVALAFRTFVDLKDIHTEGITRVTAQDIEYARELGYRIKLLAIAKATDSAVEARVHPTMIPAASPLAGRCRACSTPCSHRRRRRRPDVLRARRPADADRVRRVVGRRRDRARIAHGIPSLALELPSIGAARAAARRWSDPLPLLPARDAQDKPGVLSRVAGILGENDISIAIVHPEGPRAARGGAGGHADARGARARHARGAGADRPPARRRGGATMIIRVEGGPQ